MPLISFYSTRVFRIALCLLAVGLLFIPLAAQQKPVAKYVFFLHNRYVELSDLETPHPQYGKAEYLEILESFRRAGFTVISEKRKSDTDIKVYARKVTQQIDSLLHLGVKPGNITVIGTSKGGYIAQYVSTFMNSPDMNYVFVGCFRDTDIKELPDINLSGNVLFIYERSDPYGVPAAKRVSSSRNKVSRFREIALNTQLNHGFLYHPMPEWIEPGVQWAKGDHGSVTAATLNREMNSLLASRPGEPFSGVILVQEGNQLRFQYAAGESDREGHTTIHADDRFVIGSLSKQFTAAMVLQEMDKGHLKLNDAISKFLPGLQQPWKDSVTILHLLTHTHGLAAIDRPQAFKAGARMDYENGNDVGYGLLARILERTSGRSFAALSAALFRSCNMNNTYCPGTAEHKRPVKGYTQDASGKLIAEQDSFPYSIAAGGFVSNAGDLVKWNERLHHGTILKPATYKLMTSIQQNAVRRHPIWGATEYGLGLTVSDTLDLLQLGQTGFAPGFMSLNFYYPASHTSLIVLQNVVYNDATLKEKFYYIVKAAGLLRKELTGGR